MRRRLARREQLVRARTRAKNEIHAALMRRLKGKPPVSDVFGVKGREWLRALELPVEEAETLEACMRHIEFLDAEVAEVERQIAREALRWLDVRRLMSVPGVNVICAAEFMAAIDDIRRFKTSRQLAAYLGLDPKVRQSGGQPARSGRISKQRSPSARWALVEAAWSVVHQPGPLHAYYERLRARRGHGKAFVAVKGSLDKVERDAWTDFFVKDAFAHSLYSPYHQYAGLWEQAKSATRRADRGQGPAAPRR
jgi:transposase